AIVESPSGTSVSDTSGRHSATSLSANTAEGGLGGLRFERLHAVQDGGDYVLVPDYRVDHQVIEGAHRPVGIEVVFDVRDPLLVHVLHQVLGLLQALAHLQQAANFFLVRSIGKDAEGIVAFAQEKRGATADNHRVAFGRNRAHDLAHHGHHAIGIERV